MMRVMIYRWRRRTRRLRHYHMVSLRALLMVMGMFTHVGGGGKGGGGEVMKM